MKIRRDNYAKTVKYRALVCGDVFYLPYDREHTIYMVMESIIDIEGKEWNAVSLDEGEASVFNLDQDVVVVNGAFVVD